MVRPASRSAAVSPRQAMTVSPLSSAAVALAAMSSLVSPFWRRSLWPRMAYLRPRSLSMLADTSPVCAPVVACASCAATAKSLRSARLTSERYGKGGATTTSVDEAVLPPLRLASHVRTCAWLPLAFQLLRGGAGRVRGEGEDGGGETE